MAKWREKNNIELLLKKMEKTRHVNDDGQVVFKGMDIILIPPRIEAVVELSPEVPEDEKQGIVWQGIRNAGRKGALSTKSVLSEIKKLEQQCLSRERREYVFISKISVDSSRHSLDQFQINDCIISFPKDLTENFYKNINKCDFVGIRSYKMSEMTRNYTWIRVETSAKSMFESAEQSLNALKYYCGLLNYTINYGSRSYSIGDNQYKPINRIRLGPKHTLHWPDGEIVDESVCWLEDEYCNLHDVYSNNIVGDFERIIKNFLTFHEWILESKLKEKLEDSILLYNEAFDSYSYSATFMKLWAILELLTGTGRESYDVTIRRTAFIFEDVLDAKGHLNILRDIRNNIAHKGSAYGHREIFLYDLKMYVERMMRFMMWASYNFESFEDIIQLLDCSPDNANIDRKIKILTQAKEMQKYKNY